MTAAGDDLPSYSPQLAVFSQRGQRPCAAVAVKAGCCGLAAQRRTTPPCCAELQTSFQENAESKEFWAWINNPIVVLWTDRSPEGRAGCVLVLLVAVGARHRSQVESSMVRLL